VIIEVFSKTCQRSQSIDTCLDRVFHVLTTTHKTLMPEALEDQACILKLVEFLKRSHQKSGVMETQMENSINPYLLALTLYHTQRRVMECYNSRKFEDALAQLRHGVQETIRISTQSDVKKQDARSFLGEFLNFWKDFLPETFFRVWEISGSMSFMRYVLVPRKGMTLFAYRPRSLVPTILTETRLRSFRTSGTIPHQEQTHLFKPVDMTLVEFEKLISGRISRVSDVLKSGIQTRRRRARVRSNGFTLDDILAKVKP